MKIAIFCGSSCGSDELYQRATRELGQYLAENKIDIVYGGGKVGLMGVIADAALQHGARVCGVIPKQLLEKEIAHPGLSELVVVADMHERKATIAQMADAFVALPGGIGTLEEIFEAWTWAQLGYHSKPCAFYNVDGYYADLLAMIDTMLTKGFLKATYAKKLIKTDNPESLLQQLKSYQAPMKKWS